VRFSLKAFPTAAGPRAVADHGYFIFLHYCRPSWAWPTPSGAGRRSSGSGGSEVLKSPLFRDDGWAWGDAGTSDVILNNGYLMCNTLRTTDQDIHTVAVQAAPQIGVPVGRAAPDRPARRGIHPVGDAGGRRLHNPGI
jgi:hypothetical protein